ncbi:hypothetical protein AFAE65S_03692 [Alcaligenes phenolicus]
MKVTTQRAVAPAAYGTTSLLITNDKQFLAIATGPMGALGSPDLQKRWSIRTFQGGIRQR